jgi:peptidase E
MAAADGPIVLVSFELPDGPIHDRVMSAAPSGRPLEVAYVGAANGDDPRWFEGVESVLRTRHAARVHRVVADRALHRDNEGILNSADIVYLGSGDVSRLARGLHAAGLTEPIRRRHREGALLFGVSAGAIALSRFWLEFPPASDAAPSPSLLPCLGLVEFAVDCHGEQENWEELRTLLRLWGDAAPDAIVDAFGIPSGGGLVFTHGRLDTHIGAPPLWLRLVRGRVETV